MTAKLLLHLKELIERVLHRQLLKMAESGKLRNASSIPFAHACAITCTAVGEGASHTLQCAHRIKEFAHGIDVVFHVVAHVGLDAEPGSLLLERAIDRART